MSYFSFEGYLVQVFNYSKCEISEEIDQLIRIVRTVQIRHVGDYRVDVSYSASSKRGERLR